MKGSDSTPASVVNVAREILLIGGGPMSTMKLQKLCYFAQGWTLAWGKGLPLFNEEFQAWRNGPVCYELFDVHRGLYAVSTEDIPPTGSPVQEWQRAMIEATIEPYMPLTGAQLSLLTHEPDTPWATARPGLPETASSRQIISKSSMQEFFTRLLPEDGS